MLHLRKTDKTQNQTTLMLWEGNRQIQEYTDQLIFTTVYDQDSFVPILRLVQDRQDTSQIKVYHYHNNHLGTPQELTNEQGEVVWCNYEFAWGGRYTHFYKEQSLNNCDILEHELQPIRFQGQFYDVETGLHYNRFRYYDSDVGMFIQRDPIGLLGGVNVFAYAPNPIHWVDPWGLSCTKELKKEMNKANRLLAKNFKFQKRAWRKEKGSAAHHLVAGDDIRALPARQILQKHNININGADNGIYLKHMDPNSIQPGAYHRIIHTNAYYDNINRRIAIADKLNGKQGVLDELEKIRDDLLFNIKIW